MNKRMDHITALEKTLEANASESSAARPILRVDVEKYQAFLDDTDLSETQKEQLIEALWSIIVSFVELGFGVHPVQEACGQLPETETERGKSDADALYSKDGLSDDFKEAVTACGPEAVTE